MTRSQLIAKVACQTGLGAAKTEVILDTIVDDIIEALADGDKVTIAGLGRFEMRQRKTKAYTNPKTNEFTQLEPTEIPGFKASGLFKDRIAKGK